MNWQLLGSLLIVLVIFLSSLVALIAYIRHWASRQEMFVKPMRDTEGLYFKRYIPPSLYLQYDKEKLRRDRFYLQYIKSIKITLFVVVICMSITILFAFVYVNRDRFVSTDHVYESNVVTSVTSD